MTGQEVLETVRSIDPTTVKAVLLTVTRSMAQERWWELNSTQAREKFIALATRPELTPKQNTALGLTAMAFFLDMVKR